MRVKAAMVLRASSKPRGSLVSAFPVGSVNNALGQEGMPMLMMREERYARAEHMNMTGSIKDRMALHILTQAYQSGRTQPGDRIAEATRGNTGISFAALGQALGHPVTIFMPDWMSQERVALLRPTCELPHEPSPGFDQPRGLSRAA